MARHKDSSWELPQTGNTYESAALAVLMDIRDEMKRMNSVLNCGNFLAVPHKLDLIIVNTRKPKRRKKLATV